MIDIIHSTLLAKIDIWERGTKKYAKRHCVSRHIGWATLCYIIVTMTLCFCIIHVLAKLLLVFTERYVPEVNASKRENVPIL